MATRDARLLEVAAAQFGVLSVAQAASLGFSRSALDHRIRQGRLRRGWPGTLVVTGHPPAPEGDLFGLCLSLGDECVASHRAAAWIWGIGGYEELALEVSVPRAAARRRRWPAVVHAVSDLPPRDAAWRRGLPVTSLARTIYDLAAVAGALELERCLDDAILLHRLNARRMALWLRARELQGRRRGELDQLLGDRQVRRPTESPLEQRVEHLLTGAGLPQPVRQLEIELPDRTKVRPDLAWPQAMTLMECDGSRPHDARRVQRWDARRQNLLQLLGWLVLRATEEQLRDEPLTLVETTRLTLEARWGTGEA
jgi:very-short-patch-repair endonuclease